jgi:hypothetical protein
MQSDLSHKGRGGAEHAACPDSKLMGELCQQLSVRLMATPGYQAGGGTDTLTEGRVSIFSWKASSFG